MPKLSAGLLPYRLAESVLEVFIVHPGGPFWAKKDDGSWSLAKGEYDEGEDPWAVACREFEEEVGSPPPKGSVVHLGEVKQPSGKVITAFAIDGDLTIDVLKSNTFEMEWPRGSGTMKEFPEVDRAGWFSAAQARVKLLKGQTPFLDTLISEVGKSQAIDEGSATSSLGEAGQASLF